MSQPYSFGYEIKKLRAKIRSLKEEYTKANAHQLRMVGKMINVLGLKYIKLWK